MSTEASLAERQSDSTFCRICYSFASFDLIPTPCKCSSTIGHVHRSCLSRWIVAVRKNVCEICHEKYDENIVFVQPRNFKSLFTSFVSGPLPAIAKFALCFVSLASVGVFLTHKLLVLFEPFERAAEEVWSFRSRHLFDVAVLLPSTLSYLRLAKLSFLSLRDLLVTLRNWWHRRDERFSIQISGASGRDDNFTQRLSGASSSTLTVALANAF